MLNINKLNKLHTPQHDTTDCGVAALLTIIKYYGGNDSINRLRHLSGTTTKGTTLLGLYQAAQAVGFKAEGCQCEIEDLVNYDKPLILHLTIDGMLEHYVVCYGFDNGKFIVSDSAKYIEFYSREEMEKLWVSKTCLTIEPTNKFNTINSINDNKKKWLIDILKKDKAILIMSAVIGVATSVLGMVMAVFSQKLIDDVLPNKNIKMLIGGVILVALLVGARIFLDSIRQKLLLRQGRDFNNRIIDYFYGKLLSMNMSFFDNRKKGDMIARLNDTRRIQQTIALIFGMSAIDVIVMLVALVFTAVYSYKVAIVATVFSFLFYIVVRKNKMRIINAQKGVMAGYAMTESNFISSISGISTIKSFNKVSYYQKINKFLYALFQDKIFSAGVLKINISIMLGVLSTFITLIIIFICSIQVINDQITIGEFTAIITIMGTLMNSISNLVLMIIPLNEAKVAFDRMFEITLDVDKTPDEETVNDSCLQDVNRLTIKNLSFRFPGNKLLFESINMDFKLGEITAIIGECGSGKSTLCGVLQKFYKQEKGHLFVNNLNIKNIGDDVWLSKISVAQQIPYIFNGTVLSNICLSENEDDIIKSLELCHEYGFDKYINSLPSGYRTIVGEEGINLSGGQRQLITIARIICRQTTIIVFDEPTIVLPFV
jgi:ATP-binding cassette subfamily B protein